MPITTVAVTCTAARPDGSLIAGGKFRFLLSAADTENGLIVPKEITATANASGVAVANLWPNSLGSVGTQYRVLLSDPAGGTLDLGSCTVPTSACNLHAILGLGAAPTLDQATVAKLAAQTAAAASSASATQSATSATNAATSATAAAGSATAAQTSATSAANSVSAVATSATNAANSATAAGNSATSAAASNTAAGTSATNAASSATAAATSATSASNSASDALASKNAAATSATNSSNSATNSATSATNSANSATGAATSATAALASQTAAATSATNASTSAATASTQAGIATTQATNAATSAASAASNAAAVAAATTGNMSAQNANAVAITGGSVSGTSITVKDNAFTLQDDVDSTKQAQFNAASISANTSRNYVLPNADTTLAGLAVSQTFSNTNVFSSGSNTFGSSTVTNTQGLASGATTTGNTKTVNVGTGGLSGSTTAITVGSANGSTTTMLGSTVIGGAAGNQSLQVNNVASAVNYAQIVGAVAGGAPTLSAQGTDANISLPIISKGTGAIDLAAGSSGVNISNGGTVTAITRTAVGSGYTTNPTVVISAPTTAGGVQATASTNYNLFGVGVLSGGTGYTVSDVLTIVGGTFTDQLQFTVTAVSAGVITAVSVLTGSFGIYSSLPPSAPATVTGGTGAGATFNLSWSLRAITVATAGSGYVEQPTITFSGGGGTAAAAYAIVGSQPIIKSIGSSMAFNTPGGTQLVVSDGGGTSTDFITVVGSNFGRPVIAARPVSGTNVSLGISGTGVGGVLQFMTNNTAQVQAQVNHTASAVNYLAFTGAATGAAPTISAQGSDANINLDVTSKGVNGGINLKPNGALTVLVGQSGSGVGNHVTLYPTSNTFNWVLRGTDTNVGFILTTKGTGNFFFNTGGGTQAFISDAVSAVNCLTFVGAATGVSPSVGVAGSDTNINLKLTPKGTGVLQFGTYTAGVVAQAGYITITDAGGTSRRLLVG